MPKYQECYGWFSVDICFVCLCLNWCLAFPVLCCLEAALNTVLRCFPIHLLGNLEARDIWRKRQHERAMLSIRVHKRSLSCLANILLKMTILKILFLGSPVLKQGGAVNGAALDFCKILHASAHLLCCELTGLYMDKTAAMMNTRTCSQLLLPLHMVFSLA